jgi:hypothetical protein
MNFVTLQLVSDKCVLVMLESADRGGSLENPSFSLMVVKIDFFSVFGGFSSSSECFRLRIRRVAAWKQPSLPTWSISVMLAFCP